MLAVHRRRAKISFWIIVAVGAMLSAAFAYGIVRTSGLVARFAHSVGSAVATTCGCTSSPAFSAPTFIGGALVLLVSAAVVIAGTFRLLMLLRRTRRFFNMHRMLPLSEKLERVALQAGVEGKIRELDGTGTEVFCSGFFMPRLYVSRSVVDILNDDELRAVLEHERHHIFQRDPLRYLMVDVIAAFVRLIPGLRTIVHEYRSAVELAADEAALDRLGRVDTLGSALLKMISARREPVPVGTAVSFFETTERRIDHILGIERHPDGRRTLAAFSVVGIVFAVLLAGTAFKFSAVEARAAAPIAGKCQAVVHTCTVPKSFWSALMSTEVTFMSREQSR